MNKKILIIVLLILSALAAFMHFNKGNTIKTDKSSFAISSKAQVTKVQITKNQQTATLELIKSRWLINNSLVSDANIAQQFIANLQSITINSVVRKSQKKELVKNLHSNGTLIEIFKQEKIIKSYYINSNIYNKHLTYALFKDAQTPYIVEIPKLSRDLMPIFNLNLNIWHPNTVFNFKYDDFTGLNYKNNEDPNRSFILIKEPDGYSIKQQEKQLKQLSNQAIHQLTAILNNKKHIEDKTLYQEHFTDSILNSTPFSTITIRLTADTLQYKFYTKPALGKTGPFGKKIITDPNLFFIQINRQQLLTCKYYDFEDILGLDKTIME